MYIVVGEVSRLKLSLVFILTRRYRLKKKKLRSLYGSFYLSRTYCSMLFCHVNKDIRNTSGDHWTGDPHDQNGEGRPVARTWRGKSRPRGRAAVETKQNLTMSSQSSYVFYIYIYTYLYVCIDCTKIVYRLCVGVYSLWLLFWRILWMVLSPFLKAKGVMALELLKHADGAQL